MEEHGLNERQLIGSRIREARVGRRMSQADLAAKANMVRDYNEKNNK